MFDLPVTALIKPYQKIFVMKIGERKIMVIKKDFQVEMLFIQKNISGRILRNG